MRHWRLTFLIGAAQLAGVVILFAFAYSVAHAAFTDITPIVDDPFDTQSSQPSFIIFQGNQMGYVDGSCDTSLNSLLGNAGGGGATTTFHMANWYDNNNGLNAGNMSGLPAGQYTIMFGTIPAGCVWMYGIDIRGMFYWTGTAMANLLPPPAGSPSIIFPLTPNAAGGLSTTMATTTVIFSANYLYNASTTSDVYNQLNLYLTESDSMAASSTVYTLAPIVSGATSTMTTTLNLPAGSGWRYNWCWGIAAPWGEISGACSPTMDVFTITNPIIAAFGTSTASLGIYATSTCSISNVTGCVQNAIAFLFWPDEATFRSFNGLTGNIRTHAPFGYAYLLMGQIGGLSDSAAPSFSLSIDPTIQSDFFSPIKNALAAILWALAGIWLFIRVRDLDF